TSWSLASRSLLEVLAGLGGVDGQVTWLPVGWADLAVLGDELERLDEAQSLIDRAADWKVVDGALAEDALRVNDEQATERHTSVAALADEDTVVAGNLLGEVSQDWDVHVAEAALIAW